MGRGEMAMTAGAEARAAAEIIDRFSDEPAPFLSILHGIDERFGYLPEGALNAVAEALRIPIAELYGTVTFYHYWRLRKPAGQPPIQMCDGPACCLKGVDALEEELPRARLPAKHSGRVERIPCPGRCDIGVPLFIGQDAFAGARPGTVAEIAPATSPLPPETGLVECLFEGIRDGDRSVAGYRKRGGYEALQPAVSAPETVLAELKESGLTGRGGAGFPTWAKWDAVRREAADEKYIICNADEGEPGCFKDRLLLDHDPQAILEGMAAAGLVTGARTGIIYLRYEYGHTLGTLEHAIAEAEREGLLGEDVQGSGRAFRVVVRRGAGAYICGEETSLLSSLEGRHPFPRDKPPFPTTCGLFGMPTVINNVETFAAVPPILRRGGAWYRGLGIGDRAGTRIFSVSGDIERPGNYELPVGTPLRELLEEHAGGAPGGRGLKGVTMAGVSGGFVGAADLGVPLDPAALVKIGGMLGAGGIIVHDDSRCMVRAARACMAFFAAESCGKCFPCRIGTTRATEILAGMATGATRPDALRELEDLCNVMGEASACGLGLAAPFVVRSLERYWPDEVRAHLEGRCVAGECERR